MPHSLSTPSPRAARRFAFGRNWSGYLATIDESRIGRAEQSLCASLGVHTLRGTTFLDVGSGSGIFSLAARRLGATVHSFDYDADSVACTARLKQKYFPGEAGWVVEQGSVLDEAYLERLPQFDVVYSWGVLHHTGAMWDALGNVIPRVRAGGHLVLAIYNDQGWLSRLWSRVKRLYVSLPAPAKPLLTVPYFSAYWGAKAAIDFVRLQPFASWRAYSAGRGMSPWHDVVDWIGGYPFEVARPDRIFDFYRRRGFVLDHLTTCGGRLGCNEFVFRKMSE